MSVVGFDIGNENCVIAAVKQRAIDVLLNDESKRETPGVVSFGEKRRLFGSAAAASATMNPTSTISQVKRLIGRNFGDSKVQDDLRLFPFETSEGPHGGILIHLQYLGERHTFTPVQILAMLFSHLKQTAEKSLGAPVEDCVIGIPSYFTILQRCLYLDAAKIAGLTPLRLLHDCTATALGYGIYKTDFLKKGAFYAAFVDIGHSDTQVAIVSFEPGHMKVLSHASDSNLGARDFDEVLFRYFARQFRQQYNIDVYSSCRACIRLRAACEKLKVVLSANPEAPLNIECLMDEKDVKGFITRDEFEKLSSDLLEGIAEPCQKALMDSGVAAEKIQSVELVGSGSRIPAITRVLASVFRREPSRKLNASECVAHGCALQCAMFSPNFRVKDYEVEDSLPFSIKLRLLGDGLIHALPNGVLFHKGHPIPSDKVLEFHKGSAILMEAFYGDKHDLPPGVSSKIGLFMSEPFSVANSDNAYVKLKAVLTLHGTITLVSASLLGGSVEEPIMRSNLDLSSQRIEAESHNRSGDAENGAEVPVLSNHNRKVNAQLLLPIKEFVYDRISDTELLMAIEKEAELAEQDCKVEQAKEKRNTLESYVYETRNKILGTYKDFTAESEKEGICEKLKQTEDWLYEDGDDESAHVYADRLQNLKKLVDPIENRYKDEEARKQVVGTFVDMIREWQTTARSGSPTPSERKVILAECAKAEQWLSEIIQEVNSQPKYIDPVIWSRQIEEKAKAFQDVCRQKMNKKGYHGKLEDDGNSDHESKRDDMQVD